MANAMDSILISGSTTVLPLAQAWVDSFNCEQSDYMIIVTGGGTYAGIENLAKGKSDIALASNNNEEMKWLITENETAIGSLGFSCSEGGSVGVIDLDGVKPTAETTKNGSYQLFHDLCFYTYGDTNPGALDFIYFMIEPEGRKIAWVHGFVSL